MKRTSIWSFAALALAVAVASCRTPQQAPAGTPDPAAFLEDANDSLLRLVIESQQAGWVAQTYITPDTEAIDARATAALTTASTDLAKRAATLPTASLTPEQLRQVTVLKNTLTMAAPEDAKEAEELAQLVSEMRGMYGRAKSCPAGASGDGCLDVEGVTMVLAESRDPKRLREVWEGWHAAAQPMKGKYSRFVELSNKGAKTLGYADTGVMWRSRYDVPPDAFSAEFDRLWTQLRPLYQSLHAYVRGRLHARYGDAVPATGPIPAHMLGNIWAQDWSNVFDLVKPAGASAGVPLDAILKARKMTAVDMTRYAEGFFVSLGMPKLPQTFWDRSLLVKPRDREVVCHANAWAINFVDDIRIKMCVDPTAEDFSTLHHELGHDYYFLAYNTLPPILRDGANDGFHEAIGDTIALSVTPEYLVKIGLLDKAPDASGDIPLLLQRALEKLSFLPFGFVVDQWRWKVFSGEIAPDAYNTAWWDLRLRYQGIAPPSPRGGEFFDPGAKYHIPDNTPYARYFLAAVLQQQFHRALAKAAGCTTPLHRCSIYGSAEAGKRLQAALAMGASRPWPDVLEALTGERQMDASAMAEYYAPLKAWLDEQNKGVTIGW
jgi:peptidyl-dipeptidase A